MSTRLGLLYTRYRLGEGVCMAIPIKGLRAPLNPIAVHANLGFSQLINIVHVYTGQWVTPEFGEVRPEGPR